MLAEAATRVALCECRQAANSSIYFGVIVGNKTDGETPMARGDWTSPAAYEELGSLDAPGFAWEYLDRNPDFTQDRRRLERADRRGVLNQAEVDAFARRWGLRFRTRHRGRRRHCTLDAGRTAQRDHADGAAD